MRQRHHLGPSQKNRAANVFIIKKRKKPWAGRGVPSNCWVPYYKLVSSWIIDLFSSWACWTISALFFDATQKDNIQVLECCCRHLRSCFSLCCSRISLLWFWVIIGKVQFYLDATGKCFASSIQHYTQLNLPLAAKRRMLIFSLEEKDAEIE